MGQTGDGGGKGECLSKGSGKYEALEPKKH